MTKYIDYNDAQFLLAHHVNEAISSGLKELLESKHLYQNVVVDFPSLFKVVHDQILNENHKFAFHTFANQEFVKEGIPSEREEFVIDRGVKKYPTLTLIVQNVKLFCSICKTRETFSPTLYTDGTRAVAERNKTFPRTVAHPDRYQVFFLLFQCETCRAMPVGFLVRRLQWRLTLEGRTPFETVDVPSFMPKSERWLFSGAIVAARTGNSLAGLFYLRSFIEQFAKRQTEIKDRRTGEEILDAYQKLLPINVRDQIPSLKSWYEKLSGPIHDAKPDNSLFEEARTAIVDHFDFRRLHKIADLNLPKPEVDAASKPTS